jgi:hypothetical protein
MVLLLLNLGSKIIGTVCICCKSLYWDNKLYNVASEVLSLFSTSFYSKQSTKFIGILLFIKSG